MTTHRSFTPEFKAQVVLEVLTGVRSASEACQHYQLKPDLISLSPRMSSGVLKTKTQQDMQKSFYVVQSEQPVEAPGNHRQRGE